MTISEIASLAMSIVALSGIFIAYFKFKPEVRGMDSDTMKNYALLLDRAAKKELEYQKRIDTFEKRLEELERAVGTANDRADRFESWAKRLAGQVISLGGTPVALDPGKAPG